MAYSLRPFLVAVLLAILALAPVGCGSGQSPSGQNDSFEQPTSEDTAPPPPEPASSPALEAEPTGSVVQVGESPAGVTVDPKTGLVAVGLGEPSRLALVNEESGEVVREVDLPASPRHLNIAGPGGPVLVPAEKAWKLVQVGLPDGEIKSETDVGAIPHDAAAAPDGRIFVINEFSDTASVVENGTVVDTIDTPRQPGGVAVTGSGLVGLVGVRGLAMDVYDASTLESLGRVDAGKGPTHVVAGPDDRFYVVDTRGDAILIYQPGPEPAQTDSVSLPGTPYGIAVDPQRRYLYVTLTAENSLVQFSTEDGSLREVARYPTVRQPNTVAADTNSGRVFVTGAANGELQIINPQQGT